MSSLQNLYIKGLAGSAGASGNNMPTVTDQTTSYDTNDDGDNEFGRESTFLTLSENNPHGNTTRFLDVDGGTTFTDIYIDWAYTDIENELVMGWGFVNGSHITYAAALTEVAALTIDGLSGWSLPNLNQMLSLVSSENAGSRNLGYAPFSNTSNYRFWTGTTYDLVTTYSVVVPNRWFESSAVTKITDTNMRYYPSRIFTWAEAGVI
jgi:hypothetical protein